MPRSYRCVLIALVGWLSLAGLNQADPKAEHGQAQVQNAIAGGDGNIAITHIERAERAGGPTDDEPCGPGKYDRKSELCAQWKAADAAQDAAWWARLSSYLSVLGLIGVLGALCLTVQSNGIARRSAELSLRAYPDFDGVAFIEVTEPPDVDGVHSGIRVAVKNYGQTPAENVIFETSLSLIGAAGTVLKLSADDQRDFSSIAPTDHIYYKGTFITPVEIWDRVQANKIRLQIFVKVVFRDAFGDSRTLESSFHSDGKNEFCFVEGTRKVG